MGGGGGDLSGVLERERERERERENQSGGLEREGKSIWWIRERGEKSVWWITEREGEAESS